MTYSPSTYHGGTTVVLHGGTAFQLAALRDPALAGYRIRPVHIRDTPAAQEVLAGLGGPDTVVVADRLRPDQLRPLGDDILAVRQRGGTVVVFGINDVGSWLPGYREEERPTVFWWWRTGEDSLLRRRVPDNPIWDEFPERAVIWHYHAVLHGPDTAVSLVDKLVGDNPVFPGEADENRVDGSVLLVDDSGPGRLLVTSMDPVYHHGSGFMPGATQLLYACVRWATR